MQTPQFHLVVLAGLLLPLIAHAQPMVVLGGGQKAQECFMNAELAARNLPGVGRSLLEACDYTLKYSTSISLQDRAATLANRGIVHAAMNNFDAAMDDYNAAIDIRPAAPEFYINRGNSFFMMREYDRALDDYEESLRLGLKQEHFAHYNMGMAFERLGNDDVAEREYRLAMEIDPEWNLPRDRLQIILARRAEEALQSQD